LLFKDLENGACQLPIGRYVIGNHFSDYQMVPVSMIMNDLGPGFQGRGIFRYQICQNGAKEPW